MTYQIYTIETVSTVNFIYKIPHTLPANNITYWTELKKIEKLTRTFGSGELKIDRK